MMLTKRLKIWMMVAMGINALVMGRANATNPSSGMVVIYPEARTVVDAGPIMYVDRANRLIIIKEISHMVGQFLINEKVHTTRLVDEKGNKVDLERFKKGQWVIVRGHQIAKSKICLESVRAVNGTIEKLQQAVSRIKPIEVR